MNREQTAELVARVEWCIPRAAAPVYRRYKTWVHADDVRQQLWLWVMEHRDTTTRLLDTSDGYLVRRLRDVAERYARREKAARSGYRPDDEYFYTLPQIANLLPDALDPEVHGGTSGSMEWESSIADIRGAVAGLQPEPRARLAQWTAGGDTTEIPDDIRSILRQMQQKLGGARPLQGERK